MWPFFQVLKVFVIRVSEWERGGGGKCVKKHLYDPCDAISWLPNKKTQQQLHNTWQRAEQRRAQGAHTKSSHTHTDGSFAWHPVASERRPAQFYIFLNKYVDKKIYTIYLEIKKERKKERKKIVVVEGPGHARLHLARTGHRLLHTERKTCAAAGRVTTHRIRPKAPLDLIVAHYRNRKREPYSSLEHFL